MAVTLFSLFKEINFTKQDIENNNGEIQYKRLPFKGDA